MLTFQENNNSSNIGICTWLVFGWRILSVYAVRCGTAVKKQDDNILQSKLQYCACRKIDEIEKYLSVVQSSGAIDGDVFSYMNARENVSGVRNIMQKKNFNPNILCTFASNKSQEWCAKY